MSVVRLELTVPDGIAYETANKLSAIYAQSADPWPAGCTGAMVTVLSDEQYEPVLRPDGSYRLGLPCCSIKAEDHLRCITPDCDCSCHSRGEQS